MTNEAAEWFVLEMADFLAQGKSAEWILARAEKAFAAGDIGQVQLRKIEALVEVPTKRPCRVCKGAGSTEWHQPCRSCAGCCTEFVPTAEVV